MIEIDITDSHDQMLDHLAQRGARARGVTGHVPPPPTAPDREGTHVAVDDTVVLHPESKMWQAGDRRARIVQVNRSRVFARSFNSGRRYELRTADFTKET